MFRRDGDFFLLGTAMAAQLLQNQSPILGIPGAAWGALSSLGPGGKASGGVNRKLPRDARSVAGDRASAVESGPRKARRPEPFKAQSQWSGTALQLPQRRKRAFRLIVIGGRFEGNARSTRIRIDGKRKFLPQRCPQIVDGAVDLVGCVLANGRCGDRPAPVRKAFNTRHQMKDSREASPNVRSNRLKRHNATLHEGGVELHLFQKSGFRLGANKNMRLQLCDFVDSRPFGQRAQFIRTGSDVQFVARDGNIAEVVNAFEGKSGHTRTSQRRNWCKLQLAGSKGATGHFLAHNTNIFGEQSGAINPRRLAPINISQDGSRELRLVGTLRIGLQPAVEGARHVLHATAHAHVTDTLLAQGVVKARKERIDKALREDGFAAFLQTVENKPRVQRDEVETSVNRIADAVLPIEHRLSRAARNSCAKP